MRAEMHMWTAAARLANTMRAFACMDVKARRCTTAARFARKKKKKKTKNLFFAVFFPFSCGTPPQTGERREARELRGLRNVAKRNLFEK
jgi:hypothetical protein